jgi:hypothetical protein
VLHAAINSDPPLEIVQLLLRKGFKISDVSSNSEPCGNTGLTTSAQQKTGSGLTCLHVAVMGNVSAALYLFLVDAGAKVNAGDRVSTSISLDSVCETNLYSSYWWRHSSEWLCAKPYKDWREMLSYADFNQLSVHLLEAAVSRGADLNRENIVRLGVGGIPWVDWRTQGGRDAIYEGHAD